jgi:hypothetical protein
MGLYTLKRTSNDIEDCFVEKVKTDSIDYERHFESWLENSPSLLFDDEDGGNTVLWIGRQVTASVGDTGKYPDLLGIDSEGDLVIVELKKGRTPREVIAQILEYASWGSHLDYDSLDDLARNYYKDDESKAGKSLKQIHLEVFNIDNGIERDDFFNRRQKLYIVAEEVSPIIRQVSEYLSDKYKININHLEYEVFRTKDNEFLISVEKTLGFDSRLQSAPKSISDSSRWSGTERVKDVIHKGVLEFLGSDPAKTFAPKDIIKSLVAKYPDINTNTISCQIIQDCVNHTSRKHYPGGQSDFYFLVNKGTYRLYNPKSDGKWDWQGKPI